MAEIPEIEDAASDGEVLERLQPQVDAAIPHIVGHYANMPESSEGEELTRDIINLMISQFYFEYHPEPNEEETVEALPFEIAGVDTSQLHVGMTVKNYKEMCFLLHENPTDGNSKKAQLKEWRRFFEWDRTGQSFFIVDIYEQPLPKEDGRHDGNRAVYVRCIELILMKYLAGQKGHTMTMTRKQWWKLLGMVNERYGKISLPELEMMNQLFTQYEIRQFYQRSFRKLNEILRNAFNSMKDRALITWRIQTVVVQSERKGGWFIANDSEEEEILKAKRLVLKEMNIKKESHVFYMAKQKEFYKKVNQILYKKHGWESFFKQIRIIYNQENMIDAISEIEMELRKDELNSKVSDALNSDAEKEYQKNREKNLEGETQFRLPSQYIEAQRELTNTLISIDGDRKKTVYDYLIESHPELDELFFG